MINMVKLRALAKKIIRTLYCICPKYRLLDKFYNKITPSLLKNYINNFETKVIFDKQNYESEIKKGPTIYFDISGYVYARMFTGIQRVVANFIKYLPEICGENFDIKYIVAFSEYYQVEYVNDKWIVTSRINPSQQDIYLAIDLTAEQQLLHKKQLLAWKKQGCTLIACVHDITFLKYPQYISHYSTCKILENWFEFITQNYDGILSVSNTVKNEIIDCVQNDKKAKGDIIYGYFHNGTDFSTQNNIKEIFDETVFICVSTIEPRKGYDDLIDAFEEAASVEKNIKLIIVGHEGWKCKGLVNKIKKSSLYGNRLLWYSDCDDNQLRNLYRRANYFVSASWYEGFGLGLVEAASFGLPIVVRDIPVYREIARDRGIYFKDRKDLKNKLLFCCQNKAALQNNIIDYLTGKQSIEMAYSEIERIYLQRFIFPDRCFL